MMEREAARKRDEKTSEKKDPGIMDIQDTHSCSL